MILYGFALTVIAESVSKARWSSTTPTFPNSPRRPPGDDYPVSDSRIGYSGIVSRIGGGLAAGIHGEVQRRHSFLWR